MLFDFTSTFAQFNRPFQRIPYTESYRDYSKGGQMVKGQPLDPEDMEGIIVSLGNNDFRFDSAGTYTKQDRRLYLQEPYSLQENDTVMVDGKDFRVMGDKSYSVYAGFNTYILKRTTIGDEAK